LEGDTWSTLVNGGIMDVGHFTLAFTAGVAHGFGSVFRPDAFAVPTDEPSPFAASLRVPWCGLAARRCSAL
jgi:hypothetical protein